MAELSSLYTSLGLVDVRTYVQSGNVLFTSMEGDASRLAHGIEKEIERVFGFSVPVFMRQPKDFQRIIANNPFLKRRNEDPAWLYVTFLYSPPPASRLSNLALPGEDGDEFYVGDQEIFLFCPNGYGRTKLSNTFFERKLHVTATTRNWKTVNALYEMAMGG